MKSKQLKRLLKQLELLHEFDHQKQDCYEERKIGNEWYVKQWNGGTKRWQVAIFSEDSFRRYKSFQNKDENKENFEYAINKE